MNFLAQIAEEKIREALANGEFDNLPGAGKSLDLSDEANVPGHMRAAFKILKNAGFLPQEMQLRKEIAGLREALAVCSDEKKQAQLASMINDKWSRYHILMERNRHEG